MFIFCHNYFLFQLYGSITDQTARYLTCTSWWSDICTYCELLMLHFSKECRDFIKFLFCSMRQLTYLSQAKIFVFWVIGQTWIQFLAVVLGVSPISNLVVSERFGQRLALENGVPLLWLFSFWTQHTIQ